MISDLLAAVAIERRGVRARRLGDVLGRRPEAVTRWVARGAELRQVNTTFRDAYDQLDRALAASSPEIDGTVG